jgi:hypothetical protein
MGVIGLQACAEHYTSDWQQREVPKATRRKIAERKKSPTATTRHVAPCTQ